LDIFGQVFGHIWTYVDIFGHIWAGIWTYFDIFGDIWAGILIYVDIFWQVCSTSKSQNPENGFPEWRLHQT